MASDGIFDVQVMDEKKYQYIFDGAFHDVDDNAEFLVRIKKDLDASLSEGWGFELARRIPSQTAAVINVLSLLDEDVAWYCSEPFIEAEDYVAEKWYRKSISALKAIRMAEEEKESIRCLCLENIEKEYDQFKNRRALDSR